MVIHGHPMFLGAGDMSKHVAVFVVSFPSKPHVARVRRVGRQVSAVKVSGQLTSRCHEEETGGTCY